MSLHSQMLSSFDNRKRPQLICSNGRNENDTIINDVVDLASSDREEDKSSSESDDSDPEYDENLWEVEMIRGHWPPKATRTTPCYYYVQWKLKKGQIEDWEDEENWIPDSAMQCPELLNSYWSEVERNIRRGRKPLKLYPPDKVLEINYNGEKEKQLVSKQSRITKPQPKNKRDYKNEQRLKPNDSKRHKCLPLGKRRKEPSWQEKVNFPRDNYFVDQDDDVPAIVSDDDRPTAILREARQDNVSKKRETEKAGRSREESKERKLPQSKDRVRGERIYRKDLRSVKTKYNDRNSNLREPNRRPIDDNYEKCVTNATIKNARKIMESRREPGHWRAKESLLEGAMKQSDRCRNSAANKASPTQTPASSIISSTLERNDNNSPCQYEDFNDNFPPANQNLHSSPENLSDDDITSPPKRKRKRVICFSSDSDSEPLKTASSGNLHASKKDFRKRSPISPLSPKYTSNVSRFRYDLSDSDNDDTGEVKPLIEDLYTNNLIIAEDNPPLTPTILPATTKSFFEESVPQNEIGESTEEEIFMEMIGRFARECYGNLYDSLDRQLKPVYVFMFATYQDRDYAITVFENAKGVIPKYVCECVPVADIWNVNEQLIIDAEKRLRECRTLPPQFNLPSKRPVRATSYRTTTPLKIFPRDY